MKGIETSHGRIALVFNVILENIEKLYKTHPKTDFISFGKTLNGITILANSLDMEKGGELSEQLLELYDLPVPHFESFPASVRKPPSSARCSLYDRESGMGVGGERGKGEVRRRLLCLGD